MKIVALYKTLEGEEFIIPSIESIYNHVDKIVLVNSSLSWNNEYIVNNNIKIIDKWKLENDVFDKIISINQDCKSQNEQYDLGINYIKSNLECDYLFLIDTDEVWDELQLSLLAREVELNPNYDRYTSNLITYFKSPFYKITPPEPLHATTLIKFNKNITGYNIGVRGNGIKNYLRTNSYFHHFTYVRYSDDIIKRKFITSHLGDNIKSHSWDEWKAKYWNNAPNIQNFHPSVGYEQNWKSLTKVTIDDLPSVFKNHNNLIIEMYNNNLTPEFNYFMSSDFYKELPKGELTLEDENILFKYCKPNSNVLEIGTFLGRSACIFAYNAESVYTYDIFENFNFIKDEINKKHYFNLFKENPHFYNDIKFNLKKFENIEVINRPEEIRNDILDNSIDLIFLDGDHSKNGVESDFYEVVDTLKTNGIIIFHDSYKNENAPHHEVYKFLEEIPNYMKKIDEGGSCTVWKKNI